jgi:hypothetical protein
VLPAEVDAGEADPGLAPTGHPAVVQEYVPHVAEYRVYQLDGSLCAFHVAKPDAASPWTAPDRVAVSRADCPEAVAEAVRTLSRSWGLRFGAFDVLLTGDGEPVFLEANPDGDWLWFERKAAWAGVSVTAAVMVREVFARCSSRGSV